MDKRKQQYIGLWVISILVTLAAVFFQRITGPTNPKTVHFTLDSKEYKTSLSRSIVIPKETLGREQGERRGHPSGLVFRIVDFPEDAVITVYSKRFRTDDDWSFVTTMRRGDAFVAMLPVQPMAGKLSYYLSVSHKGQEVDILKDEPIVVRYRGDVPAWVMIPHIILMFVGMLLSNLAGLLALCRWDSFLRFAKLTLVCLFLGGLIFGPIMQKFAFDVYWAGWPFGSDLTDNKTLAVFVFWLIVVLASRTKKRYIWGVIAAVFMLLIYGIPHSTMGSEYDHTTGRVISAPRE